MGENKDSILERSKELFERFGYQKTTLTDIAKSVGKVKTAIYYYFSGKEEIFAELVKVEAETFYKRLSKAALKEDTATKKLEAYVEARIDLMHKVSKRYHFLKKEFFELMPIVEENRQVYYRKEVEMVQEIMNEGLKNNEFIIDTPEFSASMLVNSLKGLEIQMFVTDQIVVEGLNIEDFKKFILYGVIQKK